MNTNIDVSWQHLAKVSIMIKKSQKEVYDFVYHTKPRPNFLPHIKDVNILYEDDVVQEFYFKAARDDGTIAKVRTVSRCYDNIIEFFQPKPPIYLSGYFVKWIFGSDDLGNCRIRAENYWNLDNDAFERFPADQNSTTMEKVSDQIISYSLKALQALKGVMEKT